MSDTQKQKANDSKQGFLQGQLLIAMPNLGDPYFAQSVTLICQHNDEGCFGLTINHPIRISIDELLEKLEIQHKYKNTMPALRGGPVQIEQGFVIHDSQDKWENTLNINDQLSVTASKDILFDIAKDTGPDNFLIALGCASWSPGQMEDEVLNNSWLNCEPDNNIIFDMPFAERWQGAANKLGVDLNQMSDIAGHD